MYLCPGLPGRVVPVMECAAMHLLLGTVLRDDVSCNMTAFTFCPNIL